MSNTGDTDIDDILGDLFVATHGGKTAHDVEDKSDAIDYSDAAKALKAAITKKQTNLLIAELKKLDEHTAAPEEFAYYMHGIIEDRIKALQATKDET